MYSSLSGLVRFIYQASFDDDMITAISHGGSSFLLQDLVLEWCARAWCARTLNALPRAPIRYRDYVASSHDGGRALDVIYSPIYFTLKAESFMWDLIGAVLSSSCSGATPASSRAVFVDSGANEGVWSLIGAAHGCHVIAVKPQPHGSRGS